MLVDPNHVKPLYCSINTEKMLQRTSFGLCQIMGATARFLGFKGWLTKLYEPEINKVWAQKYLDWLAETYKLSTPEDLAAAYNAGRVQKDKNRRYKNQRYVNKVMATANRLAKEEKNVEGLRIAK